MTHKTIPFFRSKFTSFGAKALGFTTSGATAYYLGKAYSYQPESAETPLVCLEAIKMSQEKGQLNVNLNHLVSTLGASMYAGSIVETATKELLQNAFDAVKAAKHKGLIEEGDIHISFNSKERSITIEDNGIGMSRKIIQEAFFTVGGSHKDLPPELCSGGYGQAKIAFLLSVSKIHISSTQNGVKTQVTTHPSELLNSQFDIITEPSSEKNGTKVTVWIPERTQKGSYISFPHNVYKHNFDLPKVLSRPLIGHTKIHLTTDEFSSKPPLGTEFNQPTFANITFDWGQATVYFDPKIHEPYMVTHSVLSSGIFQFEHDIKENPNSFPKLRHNIIIDIKPSVVPTDPQYPFTNNRERFRASVVKDIKKLETYLRQASQEAQNNEWIKTFTSAKCMEDPKGLKALVEAEEAAQPEVKKSSQGSNSFFSRLFRSTTSAIIEPPIITDRPISIRKLKALPCNGPIFFNQTDNSMNIDSMEESISDFYYELGSIFSELKKVTEKKPDYKKLTDYQVGIGLVKGAHGIHMKSPLNAILLNPLNPVAQSVEGIRRNYIQTMIHELAHFKIGSHGEHHNQEMTEIESYLADQGVLKKAEQEIENVIQKHSQNYPEWNAQFEKAQSTTEQSASDLC